MLLGLFHALVLGAALRVDGDVSCPAASQVSADLQQILGIADEYAPKVHATLAREGAFIRLSLIESDGTSLGERLLSADEDCLVLSRTAAVVLAAWLTDQHPEFLVALPPAPAADSSPPSGTPSAPQGASSAPPAPPAVPPPAVPAPAPVGSVTTRTTQVHASARAQSANGLSRHHLALSAAIAGGWARPNFVPGAWLGAALDPVHSGWGARISAAWLSPHSQALGAHHVSWSRWPLMLGPYLRLPTGLGTLELEAGPALGWLHLKGQDYSPNIMQSKAQVGAYGALCFMPKAVAWHPFLMAAPVWWFNNVSAASEDLRGNPTSTTHVSSLEVLFAAGVRFLP